ncbi:1597_t:CDS:2 [Cetraspora pellucida]|uniref:1597_t:CDS:1 n=1 Tax=Cetraspora pellucida TaxID=1433469 RepID=A0A9N9K7A6_9GLOM|nr:1597_t:CDS:2 [Cetraspora pellucida]
MGCITSNLSDKADSIDSQSEFQYVDANNDDEHFMIRYIWQSNFSAPIEHIISKSGSKILDVGCVNVMVVFE